MGASLAVAGDLRPERSPVLKDGLQRDGKYVLQVSAVSLPSYNFEHFMSLCHKLQQEKKSFELHIRMEIENWRVRAFEGHSTAECRYKINEMLGKFRDAQERQDVLIERERIRMDQQRAEGESEENKSKIKQRLKFFAMLNQEHESLLEKVRQDVMDCRSIYGQVLDPKIRYRIKS